MVTLPADYVQTSVELGYASTVHTAQGVTADTMHGVVTGEESRQQLYTMLTRGRSANHVYVAVVGDGDPHTVLQPNNVHLRTATDLLEQILARDASPQSATSLQREQQDPAVRLAASVERYIDALHVAAEEVIGSSAVQALEAFANQLVPGLADEPAWPTLRAHLLLLAVDGRDPHQRLRAACDPREVCSADDRAAVLDWRLHEISLPSRDGPLPWLPGIPDRIAADPRWGPYLHARSHQVDGLADQVRTNAEGQAGLGGPGARPGAGQADRRRSSRGAPLTRSTQTIYDQPGHPNPAKPLKPGNSNSTRGSPPRTPAQNGDGGNCSLQKFPLRPRTHSCHS